jgi:hypothetical protein
MSKSLLSLPDHEQPNVLQAVAEEFKLGFEELAKSAEEELYGKNFVFSRYGRELYPCFDETGAGLVPGCIIPIKEGRPVASVDSTCILVGETSRGALYSARTAVGVSFEGKLKRFFRMGPILVYASDSGLAGIRSDLSPAELGIVLSDHMSAERLIRNTVERRVIGALLAGEEEVLVMADGSLKHPMGQFSGRSPRTVGSNKRLIGFSKSSNLIYSEEVVSVLSKSDHPSYFTVDDGPVKTVLVKFSPDGLVFRLDLSEDAETSAMTLGRILWNDAFAAGYPDSLRVAHHLSVFSRAEIQALKAFVTKRFSLRRLPTFSLRTIALGSFKGGT